MWERPVKEFLGENLISGDAFIDVGAHCGIFSCYAARRVNPGWILAIEPHPGLFGWLKWNLEQNAPFEMHFEVNGAIMNYYSPEYPVKGTIWLNPAENEGDNRTVNIPQQEDPTANIVECDIYTLDFLVDTYSLNIPSGHDFFLKIDAQWAEVEVLKSGMETLKRTRAGVVEIQNETKDEVRSILESEGFSIIDLGPDYGFRRL